MTYKSKELVEEEQAIVEHALNSLIDEGLPKSANDSREADKKLRQMIAEVNSTRTLHKI